VNTARNRLVLLVPVALGAVVLIAAATSGHLLSGLIWFAILAVLGGLSALAAQIGTARRGRSHTEDERDAMINTRSMSIAGTVLVVVITGCITFTLARGESTSPYTPLMAVGGISYAVALVALRGRS
jgi:hypothetical protein